MSGKIRQVDVLETMEHFASLPGWRERVSPAVLDEMRLRLEDMLASYEDRPSNPCQEQIRYLAVSLLEQLDEPPATCSRHDPADPRKH